MRAKIMDAVKRQSEQLVVAFLKAAAGNERGAVDDILDEGSIEVDDSDGVGPCQNAIHRSICIVACCKTDFILTVGASRTALHLAAANGHLSMVTRLVTKYAASPTIKDRYGSTPIDDAIRHKHMAVVEFLATQAVATDINSDAYVEQCVLAQLQSCFNWRSNTCSHQLSHFPLHCHSNTFYHPGCLEHARAYAKYIGS